LASKATFSVFAYGSLIFCPELPGRVIGRARARLNGYDRTFNKIATSRFCPRSDSFDAFPTPDERLLKDGSYVSLVLGTCPGSGIDGIALTYPVEVRDELIALLDRREGYDPTGEKRSNGYVRVTEPTVSEGGTVEPSLGACRA